MEVVGNGKIECDQQFRKSNMLRIDIKLGIKCVTIKADLIEWHEKIRGCNAETLIKELVWQGVEMQRCVAK